MLQSDHNDDFETMRSVITILTHNFNTYIHGKPQINPYFNTTIRQYIFQPSRVKELLNLMITLTNSWQLAIKLPILKESLWLYFQNYFLYFLSTNFDQ